MCTVEIDVTEDDGGRSAAISKIVRQMDFENRPIISTI